MEPSTVKVYRETFPDVTLDKIAESDITRQDENGKRFRIWMRRPQEEESIEAELRMKLFLGRSA